MTLLEQFESHTGLVVHKYPHHLAAYERVFAPYVGRDVGVLELGIGGGGSLQLWRNYFGPRCRVVGIDIEDCTFAQREGITVLKGEQTQHELLDQAVAQLPSLDIVIDDASHRGFDQRCSFRYLFPKLASPGVYCVEDLHTSYRADFGGAYKGPQSFVEYVKEMLDVLHALEDGVPSMPEFAGLFSVQLVPSLAIIEKRPTWTWGGATMRGSRA